MPSFGTTTAARPTSSGLRAANRAAVLDVLRTRGQATRAELCGLTGLSRSTVSGLVGELCRRGLVVERESATAPGSVGRRPTVLTLDRSAGLAVGVDLGVRHIAVAVGDLSRTVHVERWRGLPVSRPGDGPHHGVRLVIAALKDALHEAGADPDQVIGAAVSVAAPVRRDTGAIASPDVLPGWAGVQVAEAITDELGIPAVQDNDANLGALGELTWGDVSGVRDLVYVKVASRVGAGLVLGGSVYRGRDGCAGEIGHVPVVAGGLPCWCGGRGCLELYASGAAVARSLAERGRRFTSLRQLVDAARAGDPQVTGAVRVAGRILGRGLRTVMMTVNPERFVIGGELSSLGDVLLDPIRSGLEDSSFGGTAQVGLASLGARASLCGALALVLSEPARFGVPTSSATASTTTSTAPRPASTTTSTAPRPASAVTSTGPRSAAVPASRTATATPAAPATPVALRS